MAGKAFLVGAGPGDPELLTLKAARAIGVAGPAIVVVGEVVRLADLARLSPRIAEAA